MRRGEECRACLGEFQTRLDDVLNSISFKEITKVYRE